MVSRRFSKFAFYFRVVGPIPIFPAVNFAETDDAAVALGGTMQPLTLDVTVGDELARET